MIKQPRSANADIRILLVEDSPTVRRYLASLIEETPGMTVIGEAHDGAQALDMVAQLHPDVVSMDIQMPGVDGLEATRRIMSKHPTPVVVVSGMIDRDVQMSLDALDAGALAVVSKPPDRRNPAFANRRRELITTLRAMSAVRVISRRHYPAPPHHDGAVSAAQSKPLARRPRILAVGASTGGPSTLQRVLAQFSPDFALPIVVAQHMGDDFLAGLVRWLDAATPLPVQLAQAGRLIEPGHVYVASGNAHLTVQHDGQKAFVRYVTTPHGSRYTPSVDVLFESVVKSFGSQAIGLLLTGMGDDGAEGLLALRKAGAATIVQDEATSTVFGMPRAAILHGAAEYIEPLEQIAPRIQQLL